MKRIISILIAISILFTAFIISVSAENYKLEWDKDLYYKESDETAVLTITPPAGTYIKEVKVGNCFRMSHSGNVYTFDLSVYEQPNDIIVTFSDGTQAQTTLFVIKDTTPVDVELVWQGYESDNSCAYLYLDMPWSATIYSVKCDNPDITPAFYQKNITFWLHGVTTDSEVTIMLTNGQIINTTLVVPKPQAPETTTVPETTTIEPVQAKLRWNKEFYVKSQDEMAILYITPPEGAGIKNFKVTNGASISYSYTTGSSVVRFFFSRYKKAVDITVYFTDGSTLSTTLYMIDDTITETTTEKTVTDTDSGFSKGDIDGNGKITAADARTILRIAAKLETVTDNKRNVADYNSDSKVTAADARSVLRVSAKLDTWVK